jgi:HEAT repeat protein
VQLDEPPEVPELDENEIQADEPDESGWVESGNPASIPLLIRYLRFSELEPTKRMALAEFAGMGVKAKSAVPAIVEALSDPKSSIRIKAATTLIQMNVQSKAAVGALMTEMKAADATSRALAAKAIGDLLDPPVENLGTNCWGPDPPPPIARPWVGKLTFSALVAARNDPDRRVRASAARALSKLERFTAVKQDNKG